MRLIRTGTDELPLRNVANRYGVGHTNHAKQPTAMSKANTTTARCAEVGPDPIAKAACGGGAGSADVADGGTNCGPQVREENGTL